MMKERINLYISAVARESARKNAFEAVMSISDWIEMVMVERLDGYRVDGGDIKGDKVRLHVMLDKDVVKRARPAAGGRFNRWVEGSIWGDVQAGEVDI